ncbi:MAG TPA: hypothetical protein VLG49_01980 [Rhabdochlamydiaceae bacterium]|nr:hypothetical protein [Rhabdochlamydiaceae bacterium]
MTINKCCYECGVPFKGNEIEYSKKIGMHEECRRQLKERVDRMCSDPNRMYLLKSARLFDDGTDLTYNMCLEAVDHKHIEKYNTILANALWRKSKL